MGLLRNRSQAQKTRRVESAGFQSIFSLYEIRDPQCLINIANPLITRYRLSRLE
jgi:hypothetical protein